MFVVVVSFCALPTTHEPCTLCEFTDLLGASWSLLSSGYMDQASWSCLRLFRHEMDWALVLALANAGKSSPARIAMIAMTTSSSMRVKARLKDCRIEDIGDSEQWLVFMFFPRLIVRRHQTSAGLGAHARSAPNPAHLAPRTSGIRL